MPELSVAVIHKMARPLPDAALESMFDMLDAELPKEGCDHTRRLTVAWLAGPLEGWLEADLWTRVWRLAAMVGAGAATYAILVIAFGVRPRALRRPGL